MKRPTKILGTPKEHVLLALAPVAGVVPVRAIADIMARVQALSSGRRGQAEIVSVALWPCISLGLVVSRGGEEYSLTRKGRLIVEAIRGVRATQLAIAAPSLERMRRYLRKTENHWGRVINLLLEERARG